MTVPWDPWQWDPGSATESLQVSTALGLALGPGEGALWAQVVVGSV